MAKTDAGGALYTLSLKDDITARIGQIDQKIKAAANRATQIGAGFQSAGKSVA